MQQFNRIIVMTIVGVLASASLCFAAHKETVRITDVKGDKVTVRRDNGAKFELRIGSGCPAIRHYERKDVTLRSGDNKFLGYNSQIVLHHEKQMCPVLKFARIQGANSHNPNPQHRR